MKKHVFLLLIVTCIVYFLGSDLLPLNKEMFLFHDVTQAARISSFADAISNGHFPPRVEGNYSFRLGYPLFNFYSPSAYWISSIPVLIGIYPITALKLSFLSALVIGWLSMYMLLKKRFGTPASILGSVAYVTSPYMASEIFVRGNLSEMWFLALLPLGFYVLVSYIEKPSYKNFCLSAVVLSFIFTTHNVLSLVSVVIFVVYVLFVLRSKRSLAPIVFGLLLGSYFLIPAVLEMSSTYASVMAAKTKYSDHFLCLWQIWTSRGWGFGGSAPGCDADGMSFKLGKIHVILASVGILTLVLQLKKVFNSFKSGKRRLSEKNAEVLFVLIIGLISLFMTTYYSSYIWQAFEGSLRVFQFPWRFLVFAVLSCSYLIAYGSEKVKKYPLYILGVFFLTILLFVGNSKYFQREGIPYHEYDQQFLTEDFKINHIAYLIPEYLPRSADLNTWLSYHSGTETPEFLRGPAEALDEGKIRNVGAESLFRRFETDSNDFYVNIHDAKYWNIRVNGDVPIVSTHDAFGRPRILMTEGPHVVEVKYAQTFLEKCANGITLISMFVLFIGFFYGRKSITSKK